MVVLGWRCVSVAVVRGWWFYRSFERNQRKGMVALGWRCVSVAVVWWWFHRSSQRYPW